MNYIGEHLLPGQLGHFFTILSFVVSLVATVSFYKATKSVIPNERESWLRLARISFITEVVCIFGTFFIIYFIISNHYHEYFYSWNHSSRSLQKEYLLAAIWEDQEGSFLLWSIWHCVLGLLIMWKVKKWEAPVMTVISFVQVCLATMLLGMYFFGQKVGGDPFILFRHQMPDLPLFTNPEYLTFPKVREGNDLNALLQNYWMVIHPPVLFLGFASTIIPFAFAYAGLVTKDHSWTKPALAWAAFSAAALGTGIMMGAAWAYESLTFGGYWAWDPVENASLVPWLVLVAGLHTNLIYKSTGYSLKSTYLFYILSFVLVLYSTFLTRSGILGDTSVHAFTGADMTVQLLLLILVFFLPAMYLFFREQKNIPTIRKEENTYSREFWMFIGSLVFFLAGIIIIAKTSIPVYNKLFNTKIAPPEDPEFSHNQIQVFIAIIIGLLTAVTQYLKYKDTPRAFISKKIWLPLLISLIISISIGYFGNINYDKKGAGFLAAIHLGIFAAVFAVVANASYIWLGLKGKLKAAGASVAHVGFGLVLVGILISSSKKEILSWNTTGINIFQKTAQQDPAENITLFKGISTDMGKYMATYVKDTFDEKSRKNFFEISFKSKDGKEEFNLYPDAIKNNKGQDGYSFNPSSKHYLHKDIFVYVSGWVPSNIKDTASFRPEAIKIGDTAFYSNGMIVLNNVLVKKPQDQDNPSSGETTMKLDLTVISKEGKRYSLLSGIALKDSSIRVLPDTAVAQSLIVRFNKVIDNQTGKLEIGVKESGTITDIVTLKVYQFPFINILWLGVVIMVVGLIMSIIQRNKKSKLNAV